MREKLQKFIIVSDSHLLKLSALGLFSGLAAAIIIVAFRFIIEATQIAILPGDDPENYEALSSLQIFLFPVVGGIIIGAIFHFIPASARATGLIHTVDAIKNHRGHLPVVNTIAQFVGAAISIIAGHSVGREGPSVHLGASSGGLVADLCNCSPQTKRILLASGVAAAIAASFNTPIAGVIFALEVIMLEYTAISTIPIIIASLTATIISHAVFGNAVTLSSPDLGIASGSALIGMTINGVAIGLVAVIFIKLLVKITQKSKPFPIFWRLTLAGIITGVLALGAPEIMSLGYDTLSDTFHGHIALSALIIILILKLLATTIGLGLGLPGGLIGPTLVIGALTGSIVGLVLKLIFPEMTTSPGLFAMIGMGAMMGATLQAPLAALIAIFELTLNPHIILPGLVAIVAASLTASELLKQPSIIFALVRSKEIDHDESLLTEKLRSMPITDIIQPVNNVDEDIKNNLKKIPDNATIADAVSAFRQTRYDQVYVCSDNTQPNKKIGIVDKQELSDFLRQFNQ